MRIDRIPTRRLLAVLTPLITGAVLPVDVPAQGVEDWAVILEPRADSVRPPPIRDAGIRWTPALPEEGSSFGIRVLRPRNSMRITTIEGSIGESALRIGRVDSDWLGIAGIPIGTAGSVELTLQLEYENGETRTQTAMIDIAAREFASTQMRVAPQYSAPPREVQARIQRDRERIGAALSSVTAEWLIDGQFRAPRPIVVTSPFGQRRVFNGELRSRHTGLDLAGDPGDPVRSSGRGRVVLADDFYFSGNGVFVDHGMGVFTGYFHLARILVEPGQMVEAGDLLGEVGSTGRVTGPHLHWSLWVDGVGLDAGSLLAIPFP